jgi:hypothetical protein
MSQGALSNEVDQDTANGSINLINAATRILDHAFKAQGDIAVEEELADLSALMAALKAGQPVAPQPEKPPEVIGMTMEEQAEASRLRVAWMGEFGHNGHDIEASLRCNRPTSVEEEQHNLDVVRAMREMEKMYPLEHRSMPLA